MKIAVASQNPVKVNATQIAFTQIFPNEEIEVDGYATPSGVSAQPTTDEETYSGALNRVENIFKQYPAYDFWVAIEGGIYDTQNEMQVFAWGLIKTKEALGKGKSGIFIIPEKMAKLIRKGVEMGEADDILFKVKNSKQKEGTVGKLTNGLIDRTAYYVHALILAYTRFNYPELYQE